MVKTGITFKSVVYGRAISWCDGLTRPGQISAALCVLQTNQVLVDLGGVTLVHNLVKIVILVQNKPGLAFQAVEIRPMFAVRHFLVLVAGQEVRGQGEPRSAHSTFIGVLIEETIGNRCSDRKTA